MMGEFRYSATDEHDAAFVEMWQDNQLVRKLVFNLEQLKERIAELQQARRDLGQKTYIDSQLGISLSPPQLESHIFQLLSLRAVLMHPPSIDRQTGVNLEKPATAAGAGGHREAGPAHGGPGSTGGGAAWQGYGSGPGSGSGGGGGHGL